MNTITTIVQFGNCKHCFLNLIDSYERKSNKSPKLKKNDEIIVYEAELSPAKIAFFSVHSLYGELSSGDLLQINGLYGHKLGIKDGDPLLLRKINAPCPKAKRVSVEPVSVDDWEILERNGGRVEQVLLDHVRVVWADQVLPVWIHRTLVVFMKIIKLEPTARCVILETNTEIIVSQKTREQRSHQPPASLNLPSLPQQQQTMSGNQPVTTPVLSTHHAPVWGAQKKSSAVAPSLGSPCRNRSRELLSSSELENVDTLEPKPVMPKSPSRSPRGTLNLRRTTQTNHLSASGRDMFQQDERHNKPMVRRQSSVMESVMRYIFPSFVSDYRSDGTSDSQSDSDAGSAIDYSMQHLPSRSSVLRVQPLGLSCTLEDCLPKPKSDIARNFQQARTMWEVRGQQASQSLDLSHRFHNLQETSPGPSSCHVIGELFQPSTIYVDAEYTKNERLLHPYLPHLPHNFIAKLTRIPSPREKAAVAQRPMRKKSNNKVNSAKDLKESAVRKNSGNPTSPPDPGARLQGGTEGGGGEESGVAADESELDELRQSCFVRVVAIDRKEGLTDESWQEAADKILSEQTLLHGHALIPDLLRRQLRLDATCSVWLQTGTVDLVIPRKIVIFPLTSVPKRYTKEIIISAFRHHIKQIASTDHPLVVFQGLFVKFMVFPGSSIEAQITFYGENDMSLAQAVTMLSEVNIESVLVVYEPVLSEDRLGVVNPRLAYFQAKDIDPMPFPVRLKSLGGVEAIAKEALQHLLACIGARPLGRHYFSPRAGVSHGMLLITGPRGSGKTALVKALCRKLSHLPVMAYILLVDCKTLRGKTVSNIQKAMEAVFDEAAWREPSVIVFDNLDAITPAPTGPETEINGEALYSAKNSQVLQGLLKYEIANNSRVTVVATSQSQSTLHPGLVSSRGVHFLQKTLNLGTPCKTAREQMLRSIMQNHSSVSVETLLTLNMAHLSAKTEGYVARDLEGLVNKALHHKLNGAKNEQISLTDDDMENALCDYKPVSIRNVALHKAGDLGWDNVGGLGDVKMALVETLHWPTKYPQLFEDCPLRLRSGILLYGAPGTGKTLLAGVVAKECGLNFISVKGPEILSKYIGASEQAVRDLFSRAQSAKPCILFFDEFDSIAPRRGHDSTGVTDRVVNQLLTQLDGVEGLHGVYVLGATSRPDLIDPALLRPGRLDKCIKCDLPDKIGRCDILEVLSRKMSLAADVQLSVLAEMCKHFTGADLKALLYNAQLKAIHEHNDCNSGTRGSIGESGAVRIHGGEMAQCGMRRRGSSFLGLRLRSGSSVGSSSNVRSISSDKNSSQDDTTVISMNDTSDPVENADSKALDETEASDNLVIHPAVNLDSGPKLVGVDRRYDDLAKDPKQGQASGGPKLVRSEEVSDDTVAPRSASSLPNGACVREDSKSKDDDLSWNHEDGTWNNSRVKDDSDRVLKSDGDDDDVRLLVNGDDLSLRKNIPQEQKVISYSENPSNEDKKTSNNVGSDVYAEDFNDDDDDDVVDCLPSLERFNTKSFNIGGNDFVDSTPKIRYEEDDFVDSARKFYPESEMQKSFTKLPHSVTDDTETNIRISISRNTDKPPDLKSFTGTDGDDLINSLSNVLKEVGNKVDRERFSSPPAINFIASSPDPTKKKVVSYECEIASDLMTATESPVQAPLSIKLIKPASKMDWTEKVVEDQGQGSTLIRDVSDTDPAQTYPPVSVSRRKRAYERNASHPVSLQDQTSQESISVFDSDTATTQHGGQRLPRSHGDRPFVVFTSLEAGLAKLSVEDEARYLAMVKSIQQRDKTLFSAANDRRRTSLQLTAKPNVLLQVSMRHLVEAAKQMRPSVSEKEREKYLNIYEKFTSSRKNDFDSTSGVAEDTIGKRATLA